MPKSKNDPAFDEEGRLWFKKLEDGYPEATELGNGSVTKVSLNLTSHYELLVEFDSEWEAFYNDKMDEAVKF